MEEGVSPPDASPTAAEAEVPVYPSPFEAKGDGAARASASMPNGGKALKALQACFQAGVPAHLMYYLGHAECCGCAQA